jgi:hypothetical protein
MACEARPSRVPSVPATGEAGVYECLSKLRRDTATRPHRLDVKRPDEVALIGSLGVGSWHPMQLELTVSRIPIETSDSHHQSAGTRIYPAFQRTQMSSWPKSTGTASRSSPGGA